jgi:uncharacterized protein YcnI
MGRWAGRLGAVLAGFVVALAMTGVAYAHVEVEANPAVAGSTDAVVMFSAEAESSTAGIASVRVVLPAGIAPADVTLKKAPSGWTLTTNADGYTVGGKALAKGQPAVHSVTVARLPDSTSLVFKTLVNYSDGTVDRWIEEPTTANPNPENPAPVLKLKPGTRPAPTSAPPTTVAASTAPAVTAAVSPAGGGGDGGNAWVWWVVGALVVAAAVAIGLVMRQRSTTQGTSGER